MGFAQSNDFQGSANALFSKEVRYKEAVGSDDFVEKSEGQLAPFFGGLMKLDHISPGLVFAFGINTTDTDLKDQDDKIVNTGLGISLFKRTVNQRANTTSIGVAVAKRLNSKLSLGFGMNYLKVDELTQEYQGVVLFAAENDGQKYYQNLTQNIRQRLLVNALQPVFAVQYAPIPKISLGLTVKYATIISETFEQNQDVSVAYVDSALNVVDKATDDAIPADLGQGKVARSTAESDTDDAMKEWPIEARAGVAWFASPRFLMAFDVIHHGETKGEKKSLNREAVTNFALGTEYYATSMIPIRVGVFSNYDARPKLTAGKTNQADNIDYYGLSAFVGWVQPNSQLALGIIEQRGEGEAQKIADDTKIQKVEATSRIFAISITSTF
jgi:hypothetical protein